MKFNKKPLYYLLAAIGSSIVTVIIFSGTLFPDNTWNTMFGYIWVLITLAFVGMFFMNIKKKKPVQRF